LSQPRYGEITVRELLKAHGVRPYKAMGQNFLVDTNIPEKIVRLSGIEKSCGVLEVGPGLGALTLEISRAAGLVTAVELDGRLLPLLRDRIAGCDNVDIVEGDILKLDVVRLLYGKMPDMKYHVCSNLPYCITTPVLTMLIGTGVFEAITVMVQKEVAKRICAAPGSPDYGAFTVFIDYHTAPKILFDVPPECFTPRPEVFSSVVKMEIKKDCRLDPSEEAQFFRVVRAAFGQRRKTLVNALYASFGNSMQKAEIEDAVRKCGFETKVRGEALSMDEFIRLSSYFRTE